MCASPWKMWRANISRSTDQKLAWNRRTGQIGAPGEGAMGDFVQVQTPACRHFPQAGCFACASLMPWATRRATRPFPF